MSGLGVFLVGLAGPAIRKILLSLGIGLVSYAALTTALNSALSSAKSSWGGMTGDVAGLVQLSGAGECLSIIAGAMIARVAMLAVKRFEVLA